MRNNTHERTTLNWPESLDAVLFDWGGTLCDSAGERDVFEPAARAAIATGAAGGVAFADNACASLTAFFIESRHRTADDPEHRELDLPRLLSGWLETCGHANAPGDVRAAMSDAFWGEWVGCLTPIGDIDALLARLRQAGLRLGLVSNTATPGKWCRAELKRLGWLNCFESLTFSSEVGRRKPHPAMYEDALAKLRARGPIESHRVLFVGDNPAADIDGPRHLGMRSAHVRGAAPKPLADVRSDLSMQRATDLLDVFSASEK
jgi:putative hydrolase of the HAD superfamily